MEYLSVDQLIEINRMVLNEIRVRKADQPKLLADWKLRQTLESVKEAPGDAYDKAVVLITGLVRGHAFASGNRRTAYVAAKAFLELNGRKMDVEHDARALQGIRERFYTDEEVKTWLKGHGIREFVRGQA